MSASLCRHADRPFSFEQSADDTAALLEYLHVETFRLLPHARLAVLPDTDHMKILERTGWLVPMVLEFLDAATAP